MAGRSIGSSSAFCPPSRPAQKLVWLDLCSGLGGASQPALDRGWKVIRVDIDRRFEPDIVADIRALPLKRFHVDVLWASPPCAEFTRQSLPWFKGRYAPPSVELVRAALAAVRLINPLWWIIENVRAARGWLTPILGPVRYFSTGHVLWGSLLGLIPNVSPKKGKWVHLNGSRRWVPQWGVKEAFGPSPDRTALRAKIPYEIGDAICRAVERRTAGAA